MKSVEGKIVEITEQELYKMWLQRGMSDVMDFLSYKASFEEHDCKVINDDNGVTTAKAKATWALDTLVHAKIAYNNAVVTTDISDSIVFKPCGIPSNEIHVFSGLREVADLLGLEVLEREESEIHIKSIYFMYKDFEFFQLVD